MQDMSENAALEATKNIDIAGILWTAIQPALPYFVGVFVCVMLVAVLKRPKQTKAQKQHAYNERRSWDDLKLIRSMAPLENPGRVFGYLRKVCPYRFEDMILSELARRGINIIRGTSYSGDGGIDGQFILNGERWLIQAKRYKAYIKEDHVWAFDAVCQRRKARGLFVHTGRTPERLRQMQRQCGDVRIISGEELLKFFAGHSVSLTLAPASPVSPVEAGKPQIARVSVPPPSTGRAAIEGAVL
jgi:restriction system protein